MACNQKPTLHSFFFFFIRINSKLFEAVRVTHARTHTQTLQKNITSSLMGLSVKCFLISVMVIAPKTVHETLIQADITAESTPVRR